jgi:endonuclease/exonuclease/phosphatase family metal-dependent hydrolase
MSALVAVATVLALEMLRAYPALVVWSPGSRLLPPAAWIAAFVAPFVGAGVLVAVGLVRSPRAVLVGVAIVAAVARVAAQVAPSEMKVVFVALVLAGALALLALLATLGLPLLGAGVLAGVAIDVTLQATLGTRPLLWVSSPAALVTVVIVAFWLASLAVHRARREVFVLGRSLRSSIPLLVIGVALVAQAHLLASLGWVAHVLSSGWLAACLVIAAGAAAGTAASIWTARAPCARWAPLGMLGALAAGVLALAHHAPGWWWAPAVIAAHAGLGASLTVAGARGVGTGGVLGPVALLLVGLVLVAGGLTVLDGRGALGLSVAPPTILVALGTLAAGSVVVGRRELVPRAHLAGRVELGSLAVVLIAPAALVGLSSLVGAAQSGGVHEGDQVRIVTYNVALAFGPDGRMNLAEVGDTLSQLAPDVVALQEVPRGQLPAGGIDMLGWLGGELGMAHSAFQPAAPGALHGNAVLSRHPIVDVEQRWFGREGTALPRGAIAVLVEVPHAEPIWVIAAHLPPGGTTAQRTARVDTLVELWAGRPRTVIAADLNTQPGTSIVERLVANGLSSSWDPSSGPGHTYPADDPVARIDWILHTDDLMTTGAFVHPSTASDHRPLLAVIRPA